MKATRHNGEVITITFPTKSLGFGDVKINGTKAGVWSWTCEDYLHARFNLDGVERNVWTCVEYGKRAMAELAKILINKNLKNIDNV